MIKAIALDEEQSALEQIKKFCSQTGYINVLKTFTKSDEALRYLNNYPVDLLFADISLHSVSGINFKKMIPPNTMLICATAHAEYAVEVLT